MKRSSIIILAIVAILVIWCITLRNGLASKQNNINSQWGEVENQFQRKKNLYENVVATIKGSAKNEDTTLIKIVKLRSRIPDLDPNNPTTINQANEALGQMKQAIMNINVEAYPTLQTTQSYRDFQAQIEGTENRVTVAIRDWNNSVKDYNASLVSFPTNVLAGIFGFKEKAYYKADEGAKDTKVDFGS